LASTFHSQVILHLIFGWELLFWGGVKIGEGIFGFQPQPNQFFLFGLAKFREDWLKNATVGVSTDTQTDNN